MKLVSNPPNPYISTYHEWLEPPPPAKLEIYEETAKSILSENDSPDVPFRWSVNPYRGCQHACAYCYARPYHEYLGLGAGTDFETKLVVKLNAADLLRTAFSKRGWRGERVNFSGVTDCYQPLEAVYGVTRACLEVCRDFANPVAIVTRSYLVMRDAELLAEIDRVADAAVFESIPFADDALARLIEPQAPPPSRRFDAMRKLTAAGVRVGVLVAPVIPGLNDREIPAILKRSAEAGARQACFMPLRLPGNVASVFLERLHAALPDRAARVEARIREMRGGALTESRFVDRMRGEGEYWRSVQDLFEVHRERNGLKSASDSATSRQASKPRGASGPPIPAAQRTPGAVGGQMIWDFGT